MRKCGNCTLCCKLERIPPIEKPGNQWCQFCAMGVGCRVYGNRPQMCKDFECMWLQGHFSESSRPDRIGLYAVMQGDIAIVSVDPTLSAGQEVIDELQSRGHVLVKKDNQVTFLKGTSLPLPEKLVLEWLM